MSKNLQYPIYAKWIDVLDWILDTVEKYPKTVRYSIGSKITDYALEILELIVEAIYTKERQDLLKKINLCLEQLRVFFYLSHKRKYISINQFHFIGSNLNGIGIMVGGWGKKP